MSTSRRWRCLIELALPYPPASEPLAPAAIRQALLGLGTGDAYRNRLQSVLGDAIKTAGAGNRPQQPGRPLLVRLWVSQQPAPADAAPNDERPSGGWGFFLVERSPGEDPGPAQEGRRGESAIRPYAPACVASRTFNASSRPVAAGASCLSSSARWAQACCTISRCAAHKA
jgi:hypothetical protein